MTINELGVVLYQDYKRNTATAYLKFPNKKDEIYMGFDFDDEDDEGYIKSRSSKSKLHRHHIDGITGTINFYSDDRIHMTVYIGDQTIQFFLLPTEDYPITHRALWVASETFDNWMETSL